MAMREHAARACTRDRSGSFPPHSAGRGGSSGSGRGSARIAGPLTLARPSLLVQRRHLASPSRWSSRYLLDAAFVDRDRALLDRIALGLVALFIVQAVLNYVQAYLLSAAGERAVAGLRRELFARLLEMPPGFFAERRTGELTSRLTADVGLLQGVLSHQISEFSRQVLALVGGIVLLTWLQPRLTLTALPVAPIVVGTALFFGRRLRGMTTGVQDQVAEATAVAEEAFSPDPHGPELCPGARRTRAAMATGSRERPGGAPARPGSGRVLRDAHPFRPSAAMVFVLWQGGLLVLDGKLTAGCAGLVPAVHDHDRGLDRRAGVLLQHLPGGGRRGGAGVRDPGDAPAPSRIPSIPTPLPKPVRGRSPSRRCPSGTRTDPTLPWTLWQT